MERMRRGGRAGRSQHLGAGQGTLARSWLLAAVPAASAEGFKHGQPTRSMQTPCSSRGACSRYKGPATDAADGAAAV